MAKALSYFNEIQGYPGIYCATKGTLRCTAIRLKDDSLCLFSPVLGLTDDVCEQLKSLGNISFLLAPNHYHNKGLVEYANAFMQASIIVPKPAIPRLEKVTGLQFESLSQIEEQLPDTLSIVHTKGLKTGEIWLRATNNKGAAWIVVDAFCTTKENNKNPISDTPQILGTFPKMGVQDPATYLSWVLNQIQQDQPTLILPCHGSAIQSAQLPNKLRQLMKETLSH